MGQILFRALVGGLAGLAAWLIWEPRFPNMAADLSWRETEIKFILTIGAFVGASLGLLHGWLQGGKLHLLRGLGLGLILGFGGAYFGYNLGGTLVTSFFPNDIFTGNYSLPQQSLARIVAITPFGMMLGLAIGIGGLTPRRILVGAIGGFLGGLAAGAIFDPVSQMMAPAMLDLRGGQDIMRNGIPVRVGEIGTVGRALAAVSIGFFIGLFIGIVDRVTRTAWIRLVLGRNEGREWVVDASHTYLGRSESAQVPLFGDMNVAPMHACIARQNNAYILMDAGTPIGTYLNGQRIQQAPLFDGAQIQIGPHVLQFMMRHGSAPQRAAEQYRSQSYPQQAAVATVPSAVAYGIAGSGVGTPTMVSPQMHQTVPVRQPAPAQAPRTFSLLAMDGPLAGQQFQVRSLIDLGREAPGIPMGFDTSASRRHASAAPAPDGIQITDLGSTNGTFVNNQKVNSATARPGDIVKIGATSFRVESS